MRENRTSSVVALSFVLTLLVIAITVSYTTVAGRTAGGGGMLGAPLGDDGQPLLIAILLRNGAVALGLFTGVVTGGLGSLLGIVLIGLLVGASTAAAATEVGLAATIGSVAGYAIVELAGFVLAATAGLLPAARVVASGAGAQPRGVVARYTKGMPAALVALVAALVLIVIGAVVETVIITAREA